MRGFLTIVWRVLRVALLVAPPLAIGCGCASGYLGDRVRDAADIVTLTVGTGAGVKARAGPVLVAIIDNSDIAGLRAGQGFVDGLDLLQNEELYVLPFPLAGVKTSDWSLPYGYELFSHGWGSHSSKRGKDVLEMSPLPFFVKGNTASQYTQLEVAGGLGLTVRAGVNPGELLDFLLGFFGIDIYHDDLSRGALVGRRPIPTSNPWREAAQRKELEAKRPGAQGHSP